MKEFYGSQRIVETLSRTKEKLSEIEQDILNDRESKMVQISDEDVHNDLVEVFKGLKMGKKNITENGTYMATDDGLDGYSSVVVNVGGGSPVIDPTYLPASDVTKILTSQDTDAFNDNDNTRWGSIYNLNVSGGTNPVKDGNCIKYAPNVYGLSYIKNGEPDQDVTIYLVGKNYTTSGSQRILCLPYADAASQNPCIYSSGGNLWTSIYGSGDASTNISALNTYVGVIKINSKVASFYVNGTKVRESNITHSSGFALLNGGAANLVAAYVNTGDYYYFGVVDGGESDETIIANMQHLMEVFEIS